MNGKCWLFLIGSEGFCQIFKLQTPASLMEVINSATVCLDVDLILDAIKLGGFSKRSKTFSKQLWLGFRLR